MAWDENRWTERLSYADQSPEEAAKIIELVRKQVVRILRKSSDSDLQRAGKHSVNGRQTVMDVLKYCVGHLEHHLRFVRAKREKQGKEMW